MNNINWQDPYRKRSGQPDPMWEGNDMRGASKDSFSSQYLHQQNPGAATPKGNGRTKGSYSSQFLRKAPGPGPQTHPSFTQHPPPPQPDTAYGRGIQPDAGQIPPQAGYIPPREYPYQAHHAHQGYQPPQIPKTQSRPAAHPGYQSEQGRWQPPPQNGHQTAEPAGEQPSQVQRGGPAWRFLDLQSRKQTGDLYKKILAYKKKKQSAVFCFTSSLPGEGVTTILANLVDYIKNQRVAKKVLIIDAKLESAKLNSVFGLPKNTYGLKDILNNSVDVRSCLYQVGPNISVLCSGSQVQLSRGSLEPDEFLRVISECRQAADYILIDCPPVLSSPDVFSVAPAADVSFLVLRAVQVRRQVAERALAELQNNECKLGGVIMNRVQQVIPAWVYRYI